ncbi:Shikimate dehydrogenase [Flexistipes sinusarabici DSM 4947]|uniref:Shikimate dehydrogenase (NADP(+)) n=1 Tax=Flexistipes sinusarabici (strain ATCC 49648 / DSM 4947 / MAS 10) TaxID=717231 RepID=F8E715_FLESM|nr:shikimate dehydrogenase [Flexistipes sinusarabici]AEI14878.1 Shikimate dehydrogenase [Flexistipes sinusarabici DSM 4947]
MFFNTGIIGFPLRHSLSPLLHNFFIYHAEVNGGYCCFEVSKADNLPKTLSFLIESGFVGVNVTLPYKTDIMRYIDITDSAASEIGAVNTLLFDDSGILGLNTDVFGIEKTFKYHGISCLGKDILVLGAGGSTKALLYYLKSQSYKSLTIVNRTPVKGEEMLAHFGLNKCRVKDIDSLKKYNEYDIIINTTSMGLDGGRFLDMSNIKCREFAFDFQYSVNLTPFLKEYYKQDIICSDGLMMLIYQGAESFSRWAENIFVTKQLNIEKELEILKKKLRRAV